MKIAMPMLGISANIRMHPITEAIIVPEKYFLQA